MLQNLKVVVGILVLQDAESHEPDDAGMSVRSCHQYGDAML